MNVKAVKNVNPKLQEIRDSVLNSVPDPRCATDNLVRKTEDLHGSWLFCDPIGTKSRRAICGALCTTPNYQNGNWRDFSGELGLSWEQIACIDNSNVPDKTELALRSFCQHRDSTISQTVKALHNIKRFDAVSQLEEPVTALGNLVRQFQEEGANCIESGIRSIEGPETSSSVAVQIIRPRKYEYILAVQSMPLALRALPGRQTIVVQEARRLLSREQNNLQTRDSNTESNNVSAVARPVTQNKPEYRIAVFLTFAADGQVAAQRIARKLRTAQGVREGFGVLILDENAERIIDNPEQTITNLFYQVHYVMPIVTEGYLQAIRSRENPLFSKSSLDSLDASYAQYIHDLMIKCYTENNCRNDRFRCIIPDKAKEESGGVINPGNAKEASGGVVGVMNMLSGRTDPTLRVWAYEKDLEGLACRLASIPSSYYK